MRKMPALSHLQRVLRVAWAIIAKDIKTYYLRPQSLMFGILFPFSLFFSFSIGRDSPIAMQIPVLLALTVFFASSSIGPVIIPMERGNHTFDRFLTSPISPVTILAGKTLAGLIYGAGISTVPIIVGIFFFSSQITNAGALLTCLALSAFTYSSLGILFASIPGQTPAHVMMPLNVFRFPLIFISGVYMPLSELPFGMQLVALFSPLTHTMELSRLALGGEIFFGPLVNIAILGAFAMLFLWMSVHFHTASLRKA
jgi:ABC-2 type transport system permease protein